MGRQAPMTEVSDQFSVTPGAYEAVVEEIKEEQTKDGGKLMYTWVHRSVAPVAGLPIYNRFCIGTDNDPNADDPQTWLESIAAKQMKRAYKAHGIEVGNDIDEMNAAVVGQSAVLVIRPQKNNAQYTEVSAIYAVGEKEPGIDAPATAAATNHKPTAAKPAPRAATPPVRNPAPVAAKPAPRAAAGAKPTAKAAVPMIACGICRTDVPRAEYSAHVAACEPAEE